MSVPEADMTSTPHVASIKAMSKPFGENSGSTAIGLSAITVILPVKTSTRAILFKLQYSSERGVPGMETHWGAHPGGTWVEQAPSSWLAPTAITSPLGDHERPPSVESRGKPRLSVLSASTRWAPVATSSTQTFEKYSGV
jgi:hypothetical protein